MKIFFLLLFIESLSGTIQSKIFISNAHKHIVGGQPAPKGSFPYQVSLKYEDGNHFCGGSIINSKWILTAAHCLANIGQKSILITAGSNSRSNGRYYRSCHYIIHPGFDAISLKNDIGLIMLDSPIIFNNYVNPVSLPTANIDWTDKTAVVTGWGALSGDSGGPLVVNAVQIGIVSFGQPCALGEPDVYTRVWSYMDWIKEHIKS